MSCPLCQSQELKLIEKINTNDLVNLYILKFGFDTKYLFKSEQVEFWECLNCGLKYFFPFCGGDEKFYEYFQKYTWYYLEEKSEYDFAAKFIGVSDKVLEVGSGKGVFATKISTTDYTGLEFSKNACMLAESSGIKLINQSIENHSLLKSGEYDVVCNFQVLEHVDNINSFLQANVDCLKFGGRLILSVPSDESFFGKMVNAYLNFPPHHTSRWSDCTLKKVAEIFQLKIESFYHEELSPLHQFFYARVLIENFLRKKMGMKFHLVDTSFIHKLIRIVAFVIAKFSVKILLNKNKPLGHSVVVVYRKS